MIGDALPNIGTNFGRWHYRIPEAPDPAPKPAPKSEMQVPKDASGFQSSVSRSTTRPNVHYQAQMPTAQQLAGPNFEAIRAPTAQAAVPQDWAQPRAVQLDAPHMTASGRGEALPAVAAPWAFGASERYAQSIDPRMWARRAQTDAQLQTASATRNALSNLGAGQTGLRDQIALQGALSGAAAGVGAYSQGLAQGQQAQQSALGLAGQLGATYLDTQARNWQVAQANRAANYQALLRGRMEEMSQKAASDRTWADNWFGFAGEQMRQGTATNVANARNIASFLSEAEARRLAGLLGTQIDQGGGSANFGYGWSRPNDEAKGGGGGWKGVAVGVGLDALFAELGL